MVKSFRKYFLSISFSCALGMSALGQPMGTAFTYQGQLTDQGMPASGIYDLQFNVFGAANGGVPLTASQAASDLAISNGFFTVTLDFGSVFDGSARWLEIGVRPGISTDAFLSLTPRQQITATPYAIRAANVTGSVTASQITGTLPLAAMPREVVANLSFTSQLEASPLPMNAGELHRTWQVLWTKTNLNIVVLGDSVGGYPAEILHRTLGQFMARNGSFGQDTTSLGGNYFYIRRGYITAGTAVLDSLLYNYYVNESALGNPDNDFWNHHMHLWGAGGTNGFVQVTSQVSNGFSANALHVFYGGDPTGSGAFLVETQANGGAWGPLATLYTTNNPELQATNFSLPLASYYARCVNLSGTNAIYGIGLLQTNATQSYTLTVVATGGIEQFNNEYLAGSNAVARWWSAVKPDLIIVNQKKSSNWITTEVVNGQPFPSLPTVWPWITNSTPKSDWVISLPDPDLNASNNEARAIEREALRTWALERNLAVYDSWLWAGDTNDLAAFGFHSDAAHSTLLGQEYLFRGLPELLSLDAGTLLTRGYTSSLTPNLAGYATTSSLASYARLTGGNVFSGPQTFNGPVTHNSSLVVTGNITATGAGNFQIVATNLTGTLPAARLPAFIPASALLLPPQASGPVWEQVGAHNLMVLWSSNNVPPTLYRSYFNAMSNRVDAAW